MNRMPATDRDDVDAGLEAQLRAWMVREAPSHARAELLEAALARTRAVPRTRPAPWLGGSRRWRLGSLAVPVRLALVGLLVIALSGAAIVGARLALPRESTPPVAPTAAPGPNASLIPHASTAPAPNASPIPLGPAAEVSPFGGATLGDVTLGGPGLIAVGSVTTSGGSEATVWTSRDGTAWAQMPSTASLASGVMARVAGRGSPLVAVGTDCPPNPQQLCGFGRAWFTRDGAHWQAAASTFGGPSMGGLGYGFAAITQGGPGYVMVGGADQADNYGGTFLGPAVATSTDGSHWTIERLTGTGFDKASMGGVAAGAKGLVAVGSAVTLAPAIWTSADGASWRPVSTRDAFTSSEQLNDIAAGPGGFVAVGRGDGPLAAAWVSADGRTWTRASDDASFQGTTMTRVVWTGTTFLAMGKSGAGDGVAWVSTSGFDWTPIDTTAIFHGSPIVAGGALGSRLVLFGQDVAGHIVVAVTPAIAP